MEICKNKFVFVKHLFFKKAPCEFILVNHNPCLRSPFFACSFWLIYQSWMSFIKGNNGLKYIFDGMVVPYFSGLFYGLYPDYGIQLWQACEVLTGCQLLLGAAINYPSQKTSICGITLLSVNKLVYTSFEHMDAPSQHARLGLKE